MRQSEYGCARACARLCACVYNSPHQHFFVYFTLAHYLCLFTASLPATCVCLQLFTCNLCLFVIVPQPAHYQRVFKSRTFTVCLQPQETVLLAGRKLASGNLSRYLARMLLYKHLRVHTHPLSHTRNELYIAVPNQIRVVVLFISISICLSIQVSICLFNCLYLSIYPFIALLPPCL